MLVMRQLCLLCAVTALAAGQGIISGVVIDSASGDPVKKAVVTLTLHATPRAWATLRTDGSGQFRFENLPAGNYDLRAVKQEIGTAIYGANHAGEVGDLIALGDGGRREGLKLRFIHAASISGHVVDSEGDPVTQAQVILLRPGRNLGERVVTNYRQAQTNDRGEYRIMNVDPGSYYLSTASRPVPTGHEILVGQYYGGAREWKDSTPVTLHGGEVLTGFDFHLISQPAVQLRGRITGLPPEPAPAPPPQQAEAGGRFQMRKGFANGGQGVGISLTALEAGAQWGRGAGANGPDQTFEMGDIPPGRYRIEATTDREGKKYTGSQIIDVQPGMGDVILTMAPGLDIIGQLHVEGQLPQPPPKFSVLLATGNTNGRRGNGVGPAEVGADGKFTLKDVPPGEWDLQVNPIPRGAFLKSAMLGEKDVRFAMMQIEAGSDAPIRIVVSMHTAKISGEVDPAGGDPKGAAIILAPTGKFHDLARFYYGVTADDQGKFRIFGVAPGKYKIFAVEKLAVATLRNPEAADQLNTLLEGGAQEIDLAEDASLELHPKLIPMERAREVLP